MPHPNTGTQTNLHDLNACDREPIHVPGRVQGFGCLLMVSSDWLIRHASVNTAQILGREAESMIGTRLTAHFPENTAHRLRGTTQSLTVADIGSRLFGFDVMEDGRLFDVSVHQCTGGFTFEFEEKLARGQRVDLNLVKSLVARIGNHGDIQDLATGAARALRGITGFDRVKVYRFLPDGSGEVIAETRSASMDGYLGLRFPAGDIPKQARELYKRTVLRLIADVNGETCEILPGKTPEGDLPDLSLAATRAVSPVHLEYLRNMNVGASMSVSIMRRGELWGLFACHHATPHYLDAEQRSVAELFVQLFSHQLSEHLNDQEFMDAEEARSLHDRVLSRISDQRDLAEEFGAIAEEIWDVIGFDGVAMYTKGTYLAQGCAPTEAEFLPLARFLNTTAAGKVFATEHLGAIYEAADQISEPVAGMLALPISRNPRDYIVLFRREIAQAIKWAGPPEKPVSQDAERVRLTPRKSFSAWREIVKGRSAPWTPSELHAAGALRVTLLEIVLKVTDQAAKDREMAQQRQELLVAELNHRVRNILHLIRGVVSQGRGTGQTLDGFTAVLDGRLQAIARAHDQLTQQNWTAASLKGLLAVEGAAYADDAAERIIIEGDDVLLKPEAFSSLALVFHELVTNAAKHGGLSNGAGRVRINLCRQDAGPLSVTWREIGGPPLQPPRRRGFGLTVIERTIPFELKGEANLRFQPSGLEVAFTIPEQAFEPRKAAPGLLTQGSEIPDATPDGLLNGPVLLVEDNLMIALDAQDKLTEMGAGEVHLASSVAKAMEILRAENVGFALLDVNLGDETSAPVADWLHDHGIPFALVTGYGAAKHITEAYPACQILTKPYTADTLRKMIGQAAGAGQGP